MTHLQDSTKVYNLQGHVCGEVIDGVYHRSVSGRKAFMRGFGGGIANSIHELDQAEAMGATVAKVLDTDTGTTYTATIEHIREHGKPIEFAPYGKQLLLHFGGWIKSGRIADPLPPIKQEPSKPAPRQMGLFEVSHGR